MNTSMEEVKANQMTEIDTMGMTGFEDARSEDTIVPRIKVINALSPERLDGIASEGDVINSLTQEAVTGQRFIPVKVYYSNIHWNPDRDADVRIFCRSFDGRMGDGEAGVFACEACRKNKFDNTKVGKDAQPQCTAYLNFLGFFEGNPMPVVLSFARTNYNEGKKLLSIAKSMRQAIWNFAYVLNSTKVTKAKNMWYNIVAKMDGATTPEEREIAFEIFRAYEHAQVNAEYEDTGKTTAASTIDEDIAAEI